MTISKIHNDEATDKDKLKRDKFARALARIAETSETPLVIGLYGTWGMGKTSLMKLIEKEINKDIAVSIWFDAWKHQFDENPAVALLHTIIGELNLENKEEIKKILMIVTSAFGSMLLKATTNLKFKDIDKLAQRYEEERFSVQEKQVKLRNRIKELIEKIQNKTKSRIVFFIDDLDRCMPKKLLNLLESLKLYFNLSGCVYFIGADRSVLEQSISYHYKDLDMNETKYLDKIVQLPFIIPPIASENIEGFIKEYLPKKLNECTEILIKGLGDNPRQVKRFINTLNLNHQLATEIEIENYNPQILSLLLLIQIRAPGLYRSISIDNDLLKKLKRDDPEVKSFYKEYLSQEKRLKDVFGLISIPEKTPIEKYIYLSQLTRTKEKMIKTEEQFIEGKPKYKTLKNKINRISRDLSDLYKKDLEAADFSNADFSNKNFKYGNLRGADFQLANLKNVNFEKANLIGANFQDANLRGVNFKSASLEAIYLKGASLVEADLEKANLERAELKGTDLRYANLEGANLKYVVLENAILEGANLKDTNLQGANFKGAFMKETNLENAFLKEAILENVTGLEIDQLLKVSTLYNAFLEIELKREIMRKKPELFDKPEKSK